MNKDIDLWWFGLNIRQRWDLFYTYNPEIADAPNTIKMNLNDIYDSHIVEIYENEVANKRINVPHLKESIKWWCTLSDNHKRKIVDEYDPKILIDANRWGLDIDYIKSAVVEKIYNWKQSKRSGNLENASSMEYEIDSDISHETEYIFNISEDIPVVKESFDKFSVLISSTLKKQIIIIFIQAIVIMILGTVLLTGLFK